MKNECKNCGKCCTTIDKDFWKDYIKDWSSRFKLIKERKKYKEQKGCGALAENNCLIHVLFGFDNKPQPCKEFYCGSFHRKR